MRRLRTLHPLCLTLALLLAACESPSAGTDPITGNTPEAEIEWLRANAVPFGTVHPGGSASDLAPLGQMIGNARVVGLGEATHGSAEFFRMKHRVVEYLVRERGFRTFGIEATWAEATRINRYIHTGEGDPAALLSNLYFWTWNTREVLDMIQWMRAYNQSVPAADRVSFYGFDVQFSRVAMDEVVGYLRSVNAAAAADSVTAFYACYRQYQDDVPRPLPNYGMAPVSEKQACRTGVVAAQALLQRRAAELAGRSGSAAYNTALRTARVVVQNEDLRSEPAQSAFKRDLYMAENVVWMSEAAGPGSRLVLWAHNAHVARLPKLMGSYLGQEFGDAYVVAGFSFFRGGFNAVEATLRLGPLQALDALQGSYEYEFNRLGHARFYVDMRPARAPGGPQAARWLLGPRPFRMIGATYRLATPNDVYSQRSLAREFDIMIHLTDTSPTQLLPFHWE
jgi:erythromycin esterase